MIIVGQRQNKDVSRLQGGNLTWVHALAEDSGLASASADAVTICLLFHECSDDAKQAIAQEAFRVLRPGGILVLSDTPQQDLLSYRGFFEPHKDVWTRFEAERFLSSLGFVSCVSRGIIQGKGEGTDNRLWTWTCHKPEAPQAAKL
jgi:ubiquinone/menaquinone biosynthesis C-methylase UbiE